MKKTAGSGSAENECRSTALCKRIDPFYTGTVQCKNSLLLGGEEDIPDGQGQVVEGEHEGHDLQLGGESLYARQPRYKSTQDIQ